MRTFVKYSKDGTILATMRLDALPERMKHPFGDMDRTETAMEVTSSSRLDDVPLSDLHTEYRVDPKEQRLVRHRQRRAPAPRRRPGPKR
jgi:hypothetical protein